MPLKTGLVALAMLVLNLAGMATGGAFAAEPEPWQIGMQPPASLVAERMASFHTLVLWIITFITLFVLVLLLYVMWRFRASRNPVPTKRSHNTIIEVLWTVIPIMILVIIAIPSFKLLYYADVTPPSALTVKAVGHQWYWSYEFPDSKVAFDSQVIDDDSLKPGQIRLLDVDNRLVLPVNTNVRVLVTSDDVMHAWVVPALGLQINAVPGRLNEIWVNIERAGVYYGQCTQLCGVNHGFMPIAVEAVSQDAFAKWLQSQKKAAHDGPAGREPAQALARR
jgi:cytochrome c oxidase subunit II